MNRDYNVCPVNEDGEHGPIIRNDEDADLAGTHVSVRCEACDVTTGHPIEEFADFLEWN